MTLYLGFQRPREVSDITDNIIEMKKCGAYEVIQLSKQRTLMKENPAYGEVGALCTDTMNRD